MDVLTSQSNCVILSVEDAKKAGRFKNNLTKSSYQYQMEKITLKTHVWEGIYTISYDTIKKDLCNYIILSGLAGLCR